MVAEFDFMEYLSSRYPKSTFEVDVIIGGIVNHTARARQVGSHTPSVPATLILKQAPPYIAKVDEPAPFSQDRQLIEAAALRLFEDGGPLAGLGRPQNIVTPKVLDHDIHRFVLALEDLGPLVTLWDFLSPGICNNTDATSLKEIASNIGSRVGAFFAALHQPRLLQTITDGPVAEILNHSLTKDVVFDAAVKPIKDRLQTLGGIDSHTAEKLYARVEQDFVRDAYPGESCFQLGDFHPGSILVSPPATLSSTTGIQHEEIDPSVAVIDWEFAGTAGARGVNGDMAQFLASIQVVQMMSRPDSLCYAAAEAFTKAMCSAYREGSPWSETVRSDRSTASGAMQVFRSALILLGREIINLSGWRDMVSEGASIEQIVRAGAWYLERAGDGVEDMIQQANWDKLMSVGDGGSWPVIPWLFGMEQTI